MMRSLKTYVLRPGVKRYVANTSWLFGERLFRLAANFAVMIYVARYLGPDEFGQLSYALSFVALFGAFASLGIEGVLIRELVRSPKDRDEILGTAIWLRLTAATAVAAAIAVYARYGHLSLVESWMVAIVGFGLIFQSFLPLDAFFQSKVQVKYAVRAQLVQTTFSTVFKLSLIGLNLPVLWFAVGAALDSLVLAIGLVSNYSSLGYRPSAWVFIGRTARSLIKESWPLMLSAFAISIYMKIDQVMIRNLIDAEAVGTYAVAVRISEAWYFVPAAIAVSVYPAMIAARSSDPALYERRMRQLYGALAWMAIAVAVAVSLLSGWIVDTLFGAVYSDAARVLELQIWAGVFVAFGVVSSRWFVIEGMQHLLLVRALSGAVLNIILNLVLIPRYGIVGAAMATLIAQAFAGYLFDLATKQTRPVFKQKTRSLYSVAGGLR